MTIKNTTLYAISLILITVKGNSYATTVSTSPESLKNIGGSSYLVSEVTCGSKTDIRYIQKKVDTKKWCLGLSPEKCYSQKTKAALKTCTKKYDKLIANNQQPSTPETQVVVTKEDKKEQPVKNDVVIEKRNFNREKLIEEKAQIEAELLSVQQKKITLMRKKLELRKQLISN